MITHLLAVFRNLGNLAPERLQPQPPTSLSARHPVRFPRRARAVRGLHFRFVGVAVQECVSLASHVRIYSTSHIAHDSARPLTDGQELPTVREALCPSALTNGEYTLLLLHRISVKSLQHGEKEIRNDAQ